jgi:D-alanyl-D-alanine dipeptidase
MGTGFDDMTDLSHPALEAEMLATGRLSVVQAANRQLLRDAMFGAGFAGINSEWWHFDCGDRDIVRATYIRVL